MRVFGISLILSSCSMFGSDQEQSDPSDSQNQQEADEKIIDDLGIELNPEVNELKHPKAPTSWNTRLVIMTNPIPEPEKLEACQAQLAVVGEAATSPDTLLGAENQVYYEVRQNIDTYHWCFYFSMMKLDDVLENEFMDISVEERNQRFVKTMKALWLLARALDRSVGGEVYFTYVKKRYIQLSRDYFARDVEALSPPLGEDQGSMANPQGKKPAGAADVDL